VTGSLRPYTLLHFRLSLTIPLFGTIATTFLHTRNTSIEQEFGILGINEWAMVMHYGLDWPRGSV
jgi:hypothetical protein